ncbi:transcriptional regulator, TraR/DksA family [Draconibacterium orientale]|jgi:DnaK suppressor protein|uniref:TraR/DksA family transcriptional regulator n=1 Tax=Draconibacterium orientale TaxID=1168034 RepID=X5DIL7_9BACT|nr:TraR/DksA C4-type zinc finger protein [Draconibacterium orientale]AHW60959.1 TraR/DksA family transcriptional regulator [Draconibacterium orientale]SET86079.1 transcriptional regulator, TraR/DksA family [Draconibacterium orientale]
MAELNKVEIKVQITSEIDKTEKLIQEYTELTKPVEPENAIGRISRMDAINNKSVTEATLRKAKEKLEKLKFALSKVDDDDFGRCISCKKPIPLGRILIMPQARTCVSCSH